MRQNIKNKFSRQLDCKLYNGKYYDYMLYKGETVRQSIDDINDMAIADFSSLNVIDGKLYSDVVWSASTNNGVLLEDIGMTGVDNGFIKFDRSKISNKEFLELFFHSKYEIESGDTRLFLTPVTGNTQAFAYPMSIAESGDTKYIAFRGGFYQGFFKLYGFDYQVLPSNINRDMVLHFDIRPTTVSGDCCDTLVNSLHPENSGIFFFMGLRAENKFWELYNGSDSGRVKDNIITDGYLNEDVNDYLMRDVCDSFYENPFGNDYFSDDDYIADDSLGNIEDYTDSDGNKLIENGQYSIETDNKFIFFNQTETGFTVDTWIEGAIMKLYGRKPLGNPNYFPIMNQTETGYTVDNIDQYLEEYERNGGGKKEYDVDKDVRNNVFALRVTENGAIGYKYGVLNCDAEDKYEVIEEYSKDGMIKPDEWSSVNVRFAILNPTLNKCDNRTRKMKIMIYVNGYLVFISKELNALNFKELNDIYQKQEGVPYNISLGGGSIGLLETIMPRYYDISNYILPIERDFCGTFIGDIKSFKIYLGFIDYYSIRNYLS